MEKNNIAVMIIGWIRIQWVKNIRIKRTRFLSPNNVSLLFDMIMNKNDLNGYNGQTNQISNKLQKMSRSELNVQTSTN